MKNVIVKTAELNEDLIAQEYCSNYFMNNLNI